MDDASGSPSTARAAGAETSRGRGGLLDRWFRPVQVPEEAAGTLADLAARGSLVFVTRAAGLLNFLYLAWLLRRWNLPPLRAALGLRGPLPWLLRIRSSRASVEAALRGRQSTLVFLENGADPFPWLLDVQRRHAGAVFLVPALLLWSRRAKRLEGSFWDILYGSAERPSRFATLAAFVLNYKRALLRLGAPLDLSALIAERGGEPDALLGRKVRGALHHHLARQTRAVVGPALKSPRRMRDKILRDRSLRATMARVAQEAGRPAASVEAEAEKDLAEIASRYSPAFIELLRPILSRIFARLYDRVEVDAAGLARVKRAAAESPIVLCPSHKSHVDYLMLSWLFYVNGITPPHIAAGINLSFWPFGAIARRGGAFFIRRSMKGDRIYTATLRAYVKQLLRDGFPQEFYLEGGRSRTGKLLFPKTGLFSMEVDAWVEGAAQDVLFVPVAVDYERLMEGGSYARELAGGEKQKESLRGLLGTWKVLRRRYGRVYVRFSAPVSLRALAQERLGARAGALAPDEEGAAPASAAARSALPSTTGDKRELVQALANRVAFGIAQAITLTPVGLAATALLSHRRRGLSARELAARVDLLRAVAAQDGAPFAPDLQGAPSDPCRPGPMADALVRLSRERLVEVHEAAGEVIYRVVEEKRPVLDFYRNNVIHRYVSLALAAAAVRALGGDEAGQVRERARFLSRLLKLEFMYQSGLSFDEAFEASVDRLSRLGAVAAEGGRIAPGRDAAVLEFLSEMIRPYLEAYRVAGEAVLAAFSGPGRSAPGEGAPVALDRRALVREAMERGRAGFLSGHVALREALSKATLENAVEWLTQRGALAEAENGRLALDPQWREVELPSLLHEIGRHLGG
ncbi:1-acyl-sn-glycerol-3-phosphate acyltransferase [Anaeromyxobacter paludicola]|uniref:Glycerol-3-phosphate acyltransferase n=1 Tax=Anaeromyxobacter paludicola TaxID=2918171 RepID=A0ABM7X889_9BACT|nr:1-acyl-sn-glycerol-3-phosphate acyltransferase [Anaeromyxobacter paludicola]BDG08062.1 glycerol-3-phosphate acyltransferase [Anaeromyxobacter paludicola]